MSAVVPPLRLRRNEVDRALERVAPHWRPVLLAVRDDGLAFASISQDATPFDVSTGLPMLIGTARPETRARH